MPRSDATANRTALLDAAARLLASVGPRASLDAIAREAGVGIATLYRNFADRDELVAALVQRAFAVVADFAELAERTSRPSAELAERTSRPGAAEAEPVEALRTFLLRLLENRDRLALLLGGPGNRAGVPAPVVTPITTPIDAVLRRGVADGTIRPDANAVDVLVAAAMLASARLLPERPWQQVAQRQVSLIVDGLRAQPDNSDLTAPLSPYELDRAASGS